MRKRALLLIDLQADYFPGGLWPLSGIVEASRNATQLLEAARAAGDIVVHVRHEARAADAPFFRPGTDGTSIHGDVRPIDGELVVVKNEVNSFRQTDLAAHLARHAVTDVVVCGAMSHMCVEAVARAARDAGFGVTVAHDACATRDLEFEGQIVPAALVHAASMAALRFAYAEVLATDDVTKYFRAG